MSFEITVPRLGWSMEEGTFVRWLKQDGDFVKAGDAVFELEGEKAAQDIEAVDSGILRIPATAPKPGAIVAVGSVLGYLVLEGETIPVGITAGTVKADVASPNIVARSTEPAVAANFAAALAVPQIAPAAAPSVRRMAREKGVPLASLAGSGPAGRIMAEDVRNSVSKPRLSNEPGATRIASPRARRVAKERGIDWRGLNGTGREGRVRECDVLQASRQPASLANGTVVPVSSRRRTIANRMKASREQTAPVTLTTRIDATNLVNLRNQFKLAANGAAIPSYSDIVIKLVTLALQQHPMLAVRSEGEQWVTPGLPDGLHIGFAVDTDDGLVVPVVQNAGIMGLFDIAKKTSALVGKCRTGKLAASEMQGGVFTITNLGNFGIDAFTPIINLPETAVLGLGRIRREPVVFDNQIVARDQITLSLTFDHRIVDGAPAARFLQTVSQAIENPSAWLLRAED